MSKINQVLASMQRSISEQNNAKIDVYYTEGKGALFVPSGAALSPENVMLAVDETQLRFMSMGVA
ncbi:hypothetical protein MHB71_04765 [Paenibacillus sp. FSL H7-0940]|uniref:hypothetical protein n=1 Tax=Paenibacillus sp. FSL H7-0940 TaxID=2921443 RepID=UPI0030EE990E